jgi:Ca-activated chloride channel family protein
MRPLTGCVSTRRVRLAFFLLGVFLLASAGAVGAIDIFVRSPRAADTVFGQVEVRAEVLSAERIAEVVVRLDGEVVARIVKPPYRVVIDAGEDNRERIFEITARDVLGEEATERVVTRPLEVDFEIDLGLQQLYVTVTEGGQRVLDLERGTFAVTDNGVRQEIVTFEGGDVPLTAVLLVDASLSMRGQELQSALSGASAFALGMRQLDEAKLIAFSDRTLATTPFSSSAAAITAAIDATVAKGGTAINDHLYKALKELDPRQGRRVIILLSDGIDVESVLRMSDVLWKAGRNQALVYWIRPGSQDLSIDFFSSWRNPVAHRREIGGLERLVKESGGRILEIERVEEAAVAFREILAELRGQYVVGYYPTSDLDDGSWHQVEVQLSAPGVRVRVRGGYFDDRVK